MERGDGFYADFEAKFTEWALVEDNIRAAFVIGSRVRTDHPADKWSDMDIMLFAYNPDFFLENSDWLLRFGNVKSSFTVKTAGGDPERLTLFEGGWQVDVVVHPIEVLERLSTQKIVLSNFHRGIKVLVDKEGLSWSIFPEVFAAPISSSVSQDQFTLDIKMFWFLAVYLAKQILRDDLWPAKTRDGDMKSLLLRMIEWREKAVQGEYYDTWHAGRFLREWASPEIYGKLFEVFGHFDRADSWNALVKTCELYRELSREVAMRSGFDDTGELSKFATEWIRQHADEVKGAILH